MTNPEFWKNKKVFITGHTGFKGSWLSIWLSYLGANVKGYALAAPSTPSLFQEAKIQNILYSDIGDIRDFQALYVSIKNFQPDIIFHLAAQSLVKKSYLEPRETYEINVMGTLNLFEAIRQTCSAKVILNVTSDKCYDNKEWVWGYRETDPYGGYDPYSSSKGCAEILTASYRQSYFPPNNYLSHGCALASARAGNVIGGGDWSKDRLVPDILKSFENNQPVFIRNPNSIRPWQHVLEPLSGYLLLAEKLYLEGCKFAEGWNFGPLPGNELRVEEIVNILGKSWGGDIKWTYDNKIYHSHEANSLKLDCSKAKNLLNWTPKWDIFYVLNKIVNWHKAWLNGHNMYDYCLNEIFEYVQSSNSKSIN